MNNFQDRIEQLPEPLQRQLQARARRRLEQLGKPAPAAVQQINNAQQQLIAYYTVTESGPAAANVMEGTTSEIDGLDVQELQAHAHSQLPVHMVPGRWIALNRLPRLPNGKVSMTELPAPQNASQNRTAQKTTASADASTDTGNASMTFDVLRGILAELLAMDDIRPDDNFFELGGDSITAIQFVSRARLADIHLDVASVVKAANVQAIATAADNAKTDSAKASDSNADESADAADKGTQQQLPAHRNANTGSAPASANTADLGIDQQEIDNFLDSLD